MPSQDPRSALAQLLEMMGLHDRPVVLDFEGDPGALDIPTGGNYEGETTLLPQMPASQGASTDLPGAIDSATGILTQSLKERQDRAMLKKMQPRGHNEELMPSKNPVERIQLEQYLRALENNGPIAL